MKKLFPPMFDKPDNGLGIVSLSITNLISSLVIFGLYQFGFLYIS